MGSLAKDFISVLATLILASLITASPAVTAQTTPTWTTQLVDPRGEGGQIVFDSKDNPHILYSILSDWDLRIAQNLLNYAVWNGQNWTTQYVTIGNGATLVLDGNDNPQIINKANDSFAFITWDGTKWNTEKTVPVPEGLGDRWSGLNYDSSGNLRLVYPYGEHYDSNRQNVSLKYALWNGSNWSIQTIENRLANYSDNYTPKSVVYDSNGYPHILYQESTTHAFYSSNAISYSHMAYFTEVDIKYAVWTGSSWNIEPVVVNATSYNLVLNSMGEPSFCFVQENSTYDSEYDGWRIDASLRYAYFNGEDWGFSTIYYNGNADFIQVQLRLNNAGKPQVCYYIKNYGGASGLMFATLSHSSWTIQNISSRTFNNNAFNNIVFNDIAFDFKGNIHITYTSVIGSFHGAYRFGDLTYASLEESLETPSPDYTIWLGAASAAVAVAAGIGLLVYFKKRKH